MGDKGGYWKRQLRVNDQLLDQYSLQQRVIQMGCVSNSKPHNPNKAELKTVDEKTKESTIPPVSQNSADTSHLALGQAASQQAKDMIKLSKPKLQSIVNIESPKHSHASNLISHNIEPSQPIEPAPSIDIQDIDIINDQNVAPFQGINLSLNFLISVHQSPFSPSRFPREPTCSC